MDLEFKIKPMLQRSNYDCGQTALDMLGYDGHRMFPNGEVSSSNFDMFLETFMYALIASSHWLNQWEDATIKQICQ